MNQVQLDENLAEELVDFKLNYLVQEINQIIKKWNFTSIDQFLNDARKGLLPESENDAIDLTNLLDAREKLYQIKKEWRNPQ